MTTNTKEIQNMKTKQYTVGGMNIVVVDSGFVYVGNVTIQGNYVIVGNALNIRKWGTSLGLGELRNGPTKDTITDDCGSVIVPMNKVNHFIPCKGWNL